MNRLLRRNAKRNDDDDDNDPDYWLHSLREWRHNPCLMRPLTAGVLLVIILFGLVTTLLKFPTFLLSILLGGVLQKFNWVIEFLYPTSLGKWIHLTIAEYVSKGRMGASSGGHRSRWSTDKNRGYHSRTAEQRIEVVPSRVYIHPLPQFMDNLGYLIVCVPPPPSSPSSSSMYDKETKMSDRDEANASHGGDGVLVGILVDCGQASAIESQLDLIRNFHYPTYAQIRIDAILSTHKHHDHTGGNLAFLAKAQAAGTSTTNGWAVHPHLTVVGGAVERVPGCNCHVAHGDLVPLPSSFKTCVEVRAVCTPAHTRGSITYVLRPLSLSTSTMKSRTHGVAYLFTGDTVFCGGCGVPFEADADSASNDRAMTSTSLIRATCGSMAMERCFAEILYQCSDVDAAATAVAPSTLRRNSQDVENSTTACAYAPVPTDRIVMLPGHEYTNELLIRQLMPNNVLEACKWKNFSPSYFFETVSHLLVANHRRTLPHSSGRLVSAMTTLRRELLVNPQFRMLKKRGDVVLRSLQHWHRHFAQVKVPSSISFVSASRRNGDSILCQPGSDQWANENSKQWDLFATDLDRPVFTTVYAADLNTIIEQLSSGRMDPVTAARNLADMKTVMDLPAVGRRPIPDTLPSDRSVARSLVALCLLGSAPSALTLSDSLALKLPPPVVGKTSDKVLISKSRLLRILHVLGLVRGEDHYARISAMLNQLWKETKEYSDAMSAFDPKPTSSSIQTVTYDAVDVEVEVRTPSDDQVSLGALRWVMFGVPQAAPTLSRWRSCLPCAPPKRALSGTELAISKLHESHPVHTCGLRKHSGELVRHDLQTCLFCVSLTGSHGKLPPSVEEYDDLNGELERGGDDWDALHGESQSETAIFSPPSPSSPLATTDVASRRTLQRTSSSVSLEEPPLEEATQQILNGLLCEASL